MPQGSHAALKMTEARLDGTIFPETNKDRIGILYYLQVEGAISLYQCIGYFMRMRLWSDINDPTMLARIMKANKEQEYKDIYEYMMGLMTDYITGSVVMEDTNNMIFNREMVKSNFKNAPERYVRNLRECLVTEETLLRKHYGVSEIAQDLLLSPIHCDHIEEDSPLEATCNESENEMTISQDDVIFMDRIKEQCDKLVRIASETGVSDVQKWPLKHLQNYESLANRVQNGLEAGLERLKEIKNMFLRYQAQMEVELMQEHGIIVRQIIDVFAKYDDVLKEFHRVYICKQKLDGIIDAYMDMALIVLKHPRYTIIKGVDEKEDKKKVIKDKSKGKGKTLKNTKMYRTCHPGISTTLQILSNTSSEVFQMESYSLALVTEGGQNAGKLGNFGCPKLEKSMLSFKNIAVSGHQRESASGVRHQFLRLEYTVKVTRFDRKFELKTKSLPFHLSTSNQQSLELTGARLWYFFCNKDDMYRNCQLREKLEKDSFLQMLDQMIRTISHRGLSSNDKETIWRFIHYYKENASQQRKTITDCCFIKAVINTTRAASGDKGVDGKAKKELNFYDWYHALVFTIKHFLLKPWSEGLIYGVLTKKGVENVLLRDKFPIGTALLRPVTSELIKEKSKDGKNTEWTLIKIAVSLKVKCGRADQIAFIPITSQDIVKNGLYGSLKGIKIETPKGKQFRVKNILKAGDTLVTMEELERMYPIPLCEELETGGDGYVARVPSTKYLIKDGDEESESTPAPVQNHSGAPSFHSSPSPCIDESVCHSTDVESPCNISSVSTTGITSPSSQEYSFDGSVMNYSVENSAAASVESLDSPATRDENGIQPDFWEMAQQPGNYGHDDNQSPFNSEDSGNQFLTSAPSGSTERIELETTPDGMTSGDLTESLLAELPQDESMDLDTTVLEEIYDQMSLEDWVAFCASLEAPHINT